MSPRSKILIIPDLIPFPPQEGGKLCVYSFVDYLRKFHEIHLLLSCRYPGDHRDIISLKERWPEVQIHDVNLNEPKINKSFRGQVSSLITRIFKKIIQIFDSPQQSEKDLFGNEITTPFYPHPFLFISKLETLLSSQKFDIIQTEFTRMLNLAPFLPSHTKKIFVQIEERTGVLRDLGESHGTSSVFLKHVVGNTEFLEFSYMAKYDYIFALSQSDKKRILEQIPEARVYVSPYGLLDKDLTTTPDFDNYHPENLIFIGSEFHYPNRDAVNWFLTAIVNKFKESTFRKIYITGKWTEPTRKIFKDLDGRVEFIGFVEDLSNYLEKSISIVPIRIGGGGIRTKILTAMAHGTAVVSTSLAAIGINGKHERELVIADTEEHFVLAINKLFSEKDRTKSIVRNAFDLLRREYSQTAAGEIRNRIYREILEK